MRMVKWRWHTSKERRRLKITERGPTTAIWVQTQTTLTHKFTLLGDQEPSHLNLLSMWLLLLGLVLCVQHIYIALLINVLYQNVCIRSRYILKIDVHFHSKHSTYYFLKGCLIAGWETSYLFINFRITYTMFSR